jgi:hypothetical protein
MIELPSGLVGLLADGLGHDLTKSFDEFLHFSIVAIAAAKIGRLLLAQRSADRFAFVVSSPDEIGPVSGLGILGAGASGFAAGSIHFFDRSVADVSELVELLNQPMVFALSGGVHDVEETSLFSLSI